uniref:Integral membrane protein MviN n=1 Tax=Paulinella longichromatophora TaxID=1708747 RepID=A0A2H4ZPP9_9EUKA|nr:integral membrane protein MviN [Paulinella longichromatophora]
MEKSLRHIALIVAVATGLSKLIGLLRQQVIASVFGIGIAYDAYSYAYIFPGFLLVLLGGINGPFHSSIISILIRRPVEERNSIISGINTLVGTILCGVTGLFLVIADPLITLVGPSLTPDLHQIAVHQLQIMAPIALFAGFIGLNFGILHVAEEFWLPSISPLLSSIVIISSIALLSLHLGSNVNSPEEALLSGSVLAGATLLGAIAQWYAQLLVLCKKGFNKLTLVWDWSHPGVHELLKIMAPATLSSGMLQINVLVDLFFASGIIGAAAALSYSGILIQTPLGLISSALLVPLLPSFAKLSVANDYKGLIDRIRQGLILSNFTMLIFSGLIISLSYSVVELVYVRGAFNDYARDTVGTLLVAYAIGMPVYLGRDILVRIFYALGDGLTPLRFSILGILLNIIFDWILIGGPSPWGLQLPKFDCGTSGLVLATVGVNTISYFALLISLKNKFNSITLYKWGLDSFWLFVSAAFSSLLVWQLAERITWSSDILGNSLRICFGGIAGLIMYVFLTSFIGIEEVHYSIFKPKLSKKIMYLDSTK